MDLTKVFRFEASHSLPDYHGAQEHLHGHSYKLEVTVSGDVQPDGMILDFMILNAVVQRKILKKLNHRYLNDLLKNPSAEHVAKWIWDELSPLSFVLEEEADDPHLPEEIQHILGDRRGVKSVNTLVRLKRVKLWEGPDVYITYEGV